MRPGSEVDLFVVMPVYNEQEAIEGVVEEWLAALRSCPGTFVLCLINDGSTDDSLGRMRSIESRTSEIIVVDKPNSGHGQSCMLGYRLAVESGATSILQIDSDGQCDPAWLGEFVDQHATQACVFGNRVQRGDGIFRLVASRLLGTVVWLSTGVRVPDSNVPYRLMRTHTLGAVLPGIPKGVDLANIFVAVALQRAGTIRWVDIGFRERAAGRSSTNAAALVRKVVKLVPALRRFTA